MPWSMCDLGAPVVLYCNGPHCGKSKRLAAELGIANHVGFRGHRADVPALLNLAARTA